MYILISNDDGYLAPGLARLAAGLGKEAKISVVAPETNRSGASNSLTLDKPLRARCAENGFTYVDGTPTDCVHLALTGLLDEEPDLVVSGINAGANLGDDVIYSGTVAAAVEGRFLGLPSIAVSLAGDRLEHYDSAVRAVEVLLAQLAHNAIPADTILNINVPDLEWSSIKGFEVTRLGNRHKAESIVRDSDPRGRTIYWVGPPGAEQDAGPGTDFSAVRRGYVSVTPLHADLTRYSVLDDLATWVTGLDNA
jgi:5'-nucleotidase